MNQFSVPKLEWRRATSADIPAIENMVNRAYRGESGRTGWTTESDILGGQRTDCDLLAELFQSDDSAVLLAFDPNDQSTLLGCVHLQKKQSRGELVCYLGMLTVAIEGQRLGTGSFLLRNGEEFAKREFGCRVVEMTVISLRRELIEWYVRRGYQITKETRPFPYGDERFGVPLRPDLVFVVLNKNI